MYEFLKCLSCGEIVEVKLSADNPLFCPECRSVDNFEEVEEE